MLFNSHFVLRSFSVFLSNVSKSAECNGGGYGIDIRIDFMVKFHFMDLVAGSTLEVYL